MAKSIHVNYDTRQKFDAEFKLLVTIRGDNGEILDQHEYNVDEMVDSMLDKLNSYGKFDEFVNDKKFVIGNKVQA